MPESSMRDHRLPALAPIIEPPAQRGPAGLEGRLLSSTYAPEPGHPEYEPMLAGLRALFDRHSQGGEIVFPYETRVYFAPLTSGA